MNDYLTLGIYFNKPDDSGAETGTAPSGNRWFSPFKDEDDEGEPDGIEASRDSIQKTADAIEKGTDPDKKSKTLPYFGEDDDDEATDLPPDAQTGGQDEPDGDDDSTSDEVKGDKSKGDGEGDDDGEFYNPEIHAKDKNVYPNSYKNREQGEYAVSEKVKTFFDKAEKLESMDSDIGDSVPVAIQEKIDRYKDDATVLYGMSDDEVRELIVDLDRSLKTVDEKLQLTEKSFNETQSASKIQKEHQAAQEKAVKASVELGIADKITQLQKTNPNASMDTVLSIVDDGIQQQLDPLKKELNDHYNDEKYIKDHGLAKYNERTRELQDKVNQAEQKFTEHRKSIIDLNDAYVRLEKHKKSKEKDRPLSLREYAVKADEVYQQWAKDRSVGEFKAEIFESKNAQAENHFRDYAFAKSNRDKFDLTTKRGWGQAYDTYRSEMESRRQKAKINQVASTQDRKRRSKVDSDIPEPDKGQHAPETGYDSPLERSRSRINELAKRVDLRQV